MAMERFIAKRQLPSGRTVVVSEGEFEPRSTGSFSVRLYHAAPAGDETTFFADGVVCPRDGTVERVVLDDVNGDGEPEVIVVVRSVGTGGYVSAQAFMVDNDDRIAFFAAVRGLPPAANPVSALRQAKRTKRK